MTRVSHLFKDNYLLFSSNKQTIQATNSFKTQVIRQRCDLKKYIYNVVAAAGTISFRRLHNL